MKSIFLGLAALILGACSKGDDSSSVLNNSGSEVDRSSFDSFCASYDLFPSVEGKERGEAIQYTIRRIKFVAGIPDQDLTGPNGCIGITRKLEESIKIPFNAARGGVRYRFELGVRWNKELQKYDVDPEENFLLQDLEAFAYLKLITDLHLPHGKIKDLSYLSSMSNLQVLDVRNNLIEQLGGSVRSFARIEYLNLSFNRLKKFDGIGGKPSLKFLDLRENCSDAAPEALRPQFPNASYFAPSVDATVKCE